MKTCPYCGKEYPDDVVLCGIDQYQLEPLPNSGFPTLPSAVGNSSPLCAPPDGLPTVPERRWSQWDAWMFFAVIVLIDLNWPMLMELFYTFASSVLHDAYTGGPSPGTSMHRPISYLFPYAGNWVPGSFSYNMATLAYAGICLLVVAYFARTNNFASFCKAMGLDRKPTEYAWLGVLLAVVIRFIGHLIYGAGLTKTYPNFEVAEFLQEPGTARHLFLFPLLYAAFWEEPVYRGFLFKAFRGSYSVLLSTALVIAFTVYMHWDEYLHFGSSAILLTVFAMVQCYLREKSKSLWDCILSHLVYNLTGLFLAGVLLY